MLSLHINLHFFIAIIISWSCVSCVYVLVYACETLRTQTNYMAQPAALVMICQHIYNVRQRDEWRGSWWSDNVYILLFSVSVAHSHAAAMVALFSLLRSAFVFLFLPTYEINPNRRKKKMKSKTQKLAQAKSSQKKYKIVDYAKKKCAFRLCVCYDLQLFLFRSFWCIFVLENKKNIQLDDYGLFLVLFLLSRHGCISLERFWELRVLFFSGWLKIWHRGCFSIAYNRMANRKQRQEHGRKLA